MLELDSMYPDEEDLTDAFNREFAILRDSLSNIEQLFKRTLQSKTYLDEDETSEILHCKPDEIPAALPKYRASRRGYLYSLKEIYDFIEARRIPKR